ncbi:hypothetical protein EI42_03700 [Thermosporothrix hazakensis]|uniref:Uncharacterized protein n=2 Tax=Thermosporothrix TaxID=768650 RepID=A0A326U5N5_THEHA|nr:hypothetical protein [Thermosporothrix hazakensis]PZW27137.1 hypothetical protein EI42_03700 [Thermosporothrix hazakensis]BBH88005.1 hypothetical protein KTC_27560 [Thermosporothrix sp. COM3]GCE50422.1 hypothetical protein KTH_52910 [Thermosporothrix hazakensis]
MAGLLVPVDVAAFCVGTVDEETTRKFSGLTAAFDKGHLGMGVPGFLGSDVTCDLRDSPYDYLESGVHLHWALPDALTHATVDTTGEVCFPAAPNRWLVTRLLIQGTEPQAKTWIIESDALSEEQPAGQKVITLPVHNDPEQPFRYVGKYTEFTPTWKEPDPATGATPFEAAFGSPLHAAASGDIAFAAFYPNCRSVFGFCDTLKDLSLQEGQKALLSYVVIGWFSRREYDPCYASASIHQEKLSTLQEQQSWTFTEEEPPAYTLYHGFIQGLSWNPRTTYVESYDQPLSVVADVAVGNTPAEAFSAYFRGQQFLQTAIDEQLFTAFQVGALQELQRPQPDQLAQLYRALHTLQFSATASGKRYTIEQETDTLLPLRLAEALRLLNAYQQESDSYYAELMQYLWQLFAEWFRYFHVDIQTQQAAFQAVLKRYQSLSNLEKKQQEAQQKADNQKKLVQDMLTEQQHLKELPAPMYSAPAEPVLLLGGNGLERAQRYGGDGRYHEKGYLACRQTDQVLTAVTIQGQTCTATQFAALRLSENLPYPDTCTALLREACLLDTALMAARTGTAESDLTTALDAALRAQPQHIYTFTGMLPSPVGVRRWMGANPWLPIFLLWEVEYEPLTATVQENQPLDYDPQLFTGNYTIDPETGTIKYKTNPAHPVNPSKPIYAQRYRGSTVLSSQATLNLQELLAAHSDTEPLKKMLDHLNATPIQTQALSGFAAALLMREQSLQLRIQEPPQQMHVPVPMQNLTRALIQKKIRATTAPNFNSFFNPLRAGYIRLSSLLLVDAFGQQRTVLDRNRRIAARSLSLAETLRTTFQDQTVPDVAFCQPRLAQPSRLLFHWIAANSVSLNQTNIHPTTSPICGWLLPHRYTNSIALYNQQGSPLGTLFLNGDRSKVRWQPAPGEERFLDQPLEQVMRYENPFLRDVSLMLQKSTPAFFQAFWETLDRACNALHPLPRPDIALPNLVERPLALVQASLRLELEGEPACNQDWATLVDGQFIETDSGITKVQFPVILGHLEHLTDGLIGYFKSGQTTFDLSTFYSEAANPDATSGVIRPSQTTVLLTPRHAGESEEWKLLLLIDPHLPVHATTGILPAQQVQLPAEHTTALQRLSMTFFRAPLLYGASALTLPLAPQEGYQWSWIEEVIEGQTKKWTVQPDIHADNDSAVWAYTPQHITEGWLRLNPQLLLFSLLNPGGQPVAQRAKANTLTLTLKNKCKSSIVFQPGQLLPEGENNYGSILYLHFGGLVESQNIPEIRWKAEGWAFQRFNDTRYGNYWAFTPVAGKPITLQPEEGITLTLENVIVTSRNAQEHVYVDFYNLDGLNNGVYDILIAVQ